MYEEKYDGWRMLAYKNGRAVKLLSRAGRDHTRRFPDLVAAHGVLKPPTLILEGEVAIFDSELVSRFGWFRTKPQGPATPPVLMVLWQDVVTRGYEGLPNQRHRFHLEGRRLGC